ncbi:MAG: cbb3-type cytochrome c oxidase subunit 3 [Candidatus Rokubacteria bacterium]|nr:cbb3-type cytochrome c oxidase subunit 3 [Candidatus Rokubacteria bacterium]
MSLTDVMSGFGLQIFAETGLVLFGAAFFAIAVTTFLRRNREHFERARFLPLEDEPGSPLTGGRATHE